MNRSVDPRSGVTRRHHFFAGSVQRAIREAARQTKIAKHVTSHCLRHSYATHLLEGGTDIRTIQQLLGHRHVETTMIYTHVIKRGPLGVASPLDQMEETREPERPPVRDTPPAHAISPAKPVPDFPRLLRQVAVFLVALFLPWRARL